MSATIMSKDTAAATRHSNRYLASATLFGAIYFLLDFVCPGEQASAGATWTTWMNLGFGILLASAFLGNRFPAAEVPDRADGLITTPTSAV